jgi:hypothetical protein
MLAAFARRLLNEKGRSQPSGRHRLAGQCQTYVRSALLSEVVSANMSLLTSSLALIALSAVMAITECSISEKMVKRRSRCARQSWEDS